MDLDKTISVSPDGKVTMLYTDNLNLNALGKVRVKRASEVEFDEERNGWTVRILVGKYAGMYVNNNSATDSPEVFSRRQEALAAEVRFLNDEISKGEIHFDQ